MASVTVPAGNVLICLIMMSFLNLDLGQSSGTLGLAQRLLAKLRTLIGLLKYVLFEHFDLR